jgi:hypothetical protein
MERAAPGSPIWPCTRWGFPCRVACASRGGLLPHLFTLTGGLRPRRYVLCGTVRRVAVPSGSPACIRSPKRPVTRHRALWCSDFPPRLAPERSSALSRSRQRMRDVVQRGSGIWPKAECFRATRKAEPDSALERFRRPKDDRGNHCSLGMDGGPERLHQSLKIFPRRGFRSGGGTHRGRHMDRAGGGHSRGHRGVDPVDPRECGVRIRMVSGIHQP